jgi:hypothetical protein
LYVCDCNYINDNDSCEIDAEYGKVLDEQLIVCLTILPEHPPSDSPVGVDGIDDGVGVLTHAGREYYDIVELTQLLDE